MKIKKIKAYDPVRDFKRLPESKRNNEAEYENYVESLIRKRYSISAELSILRQRDTKPDEYAAYNAYAEQCKADARKALGIKT